ncbi:hypothetical protein VNI00_002302 [Paramarasmius palmivorus]|uniref:ribonuclease H n=1 Tax=Paramarasmius palmivorus TaxID=297713 RepID=A0AAW0E5C1_9AGAR
MLEAKIRYYAVKIGRSPGIFFTWEDCKHQVQGYLGGRYKKFLDLKDAEAWLLGAPSPTEPKSMELSESLHVRDVDVVANDTRSTDIQRSRKGKERAVDEPEATVEHCGDSAPSDQSESLIQPVPSSSSKSKGKQRAPDPEPWSPPPPTPPPLTPHDDFPEEEFFFSEDEEQNPLDDEEQYTDTEPETPPEPIKSRKLKRNKDGSGSIREDIVVYCDGACPNNGKESAKAGIGVWWGPDDKRNLSERCPGPQSNITAELTAAVRALEPTPFNQKRTLVIKTDSDFVIQCMTRYIKTWKANGWRKADGKPVKHPELISYLSALIEVREEQGQPVRFEYVKAHSGIEGNEGADQLAVKGAQLPERTPKKTWAEKEERYRKFAGAPRVRHEGSDLLAFVISSDGLEPEEDLDLEVHENDDSISAHFARKRSKAKTKEANPEPSSPPPESISTIRAGPSGVTTAQLTPVGPPQPLSRREVQAPQTPQKKSPRDEQQRLGELVRLGMKKRPETPETPRKKEHTEEEKRLAELIRSGMKKRPRAPGAVDSAENTAAGGLQRRPD